jgi:hypothetical protein
VFTEQRRRGGDRDGLAVEVGGEAEDVQHAAPGGGGRYLGDQVTVGDLLGGECFGDGQDAGGGHTGGGEDAVPLDRWALAEADFERVPETLPMTLAVLAGPEAGVVEQFRSVQDGTEFLELFLAVGGDVEHAVGGGEGAGGGGSAVLVPHGLRLAVADQVVGDHPAHSAQRGVEHADVEEGPFTGAMLAKQGAGDRERGGQAADGVAHRVTGAQGCGLRGAGNAHDPGEPLDDLVVGGSPAVGPGGAEAGDRAVDQAGIVGAESLPAEAQPLQDAGPEVLQEHVGVSKEPLEHLPSGVALEVDRHRSFAGVLGQERDAQALAGQLRIGAELAGEVA